MAGVLAVLGAAFGIVITVLWLVIGWRAMRAHERLAHSVAAIADRGDGRGDKLAAARAESRRRKRLYKEFLAENPGRSEIPPKERHGAFREWLEAKGLRAEDHEEPGGPPA